MSRSYASWVWGVVLLLLGCALTGILLSKSYSPTLGTGQGSPLTWLASFHYWSSGMLILASAVAVVWGLLSRVYEHAPKVWTAVLLLALCGFLGQVTGNLLPLEQHDVQTAVVEGNIAARAPLIGEASKELVFGGSRFSEATVSRWYGFHRFGLSLLLIGGVLLLGSSRREIKTGSLLVAPIVIALLLSLLPAPSGPLATAADFQAFDARPSWYTLPLHGLLRMFDAVGAGWIGAMVIPGALVAFLFALPLLAKRLSYSAIRAVVGVFGLVTVVATVGWAGMSAPISGPQLVATQAPVEASFVPIDRELARRGKDLFSSKGCIGCHTSHGVGTGSISLEGVGKRQPGREWYLRFIRNPQSVRPGSTMPAQSGLIDEELAALADFVRQPRPE